MSLEKINMNRMTALNIYMLREDKKMDFVSIAKAIGGFTAQECAFAWLTVKDARESFLSREKVVYRKRHTNKKVKPKQKRVDKPKNPVMMDALKKLDPDSLKTRIIKASFKVTKEDLS